MAANWHVDVSPVADVAPPVAVATYSAIVSLGVESSSLVLSRKVDRYVLVQAIAAPPTWPTSFWVAPRDDSDEALEASALSKIHALLDFASQMPAEGAGALRIALDRAYPEVALARREQHIGRSTLNFKHFEVTAQVLADGSPVWGFEVPLAGTMLPGILPLIQSGELLGQAVGAGATALDLFLQNSVRADVMRRRGAQ